MARTKAGAGPSKADMVRDAISELGDATPKEMQAYIKSKYGVEIKAQMLSSYKSNLAKKSGGAGRRGPRKASGAALGVSDITALRQLIDRVGANELIQLINALS